MTKKRTIRKVKSFNRKFYHRAKKAELIRGGKDFFDLLEKLILEAKFEVHLQFYILEYDETGKTIIDALIEKAKSGVQVFLVLDSYGSGKLDKDVIKNIKEAGIHFKWFRPVIRFNNMELGRRMHHKVLSVDERIALATGVNIADRYNDINGIPAWLDFAILVEGVTAKEIKLRCLQIWEKNSELTKRLKKFRLPHIESAILAENPLVKVSVNDWLRGRVDIHDGYKRGFSLAKHEILIAGGYFLPGRILRRKLREASERNVAISVILTKNSDVALTKEASEYLYRWMFERGIKIYEWQANIMHGKLAMVDNLWCTIGSYNMNYLSTFESLELNLEIIDASFTSQVSKMFKDIVQNECLEVQEEDYLKNLSLKKKITNWMAYIFVRNSFRLLNLFSKKQKIN